MGLFPWSITLLYTGVSCQGFNGHSSLGLPCLVCPVHNMHSQHSVCMYTYDYLVSIMHLSSREHYTIMDSCQKLDGASQILATCTRKSIPCVYARHCACVYTVTWYTKSGWNLQPCERERERKRDRGRAINWCSLLHITCKCDLVHFLHCTCMHASCLMFWR